MEGVRQATGAFFAANDILDGGGVAVCRSGSG
ncbi:hypothetical protein I656_02121 [Geobacillus sp. WSUCF1]|nr:hypothetical protein I656_02121 [Geobacillus sp. WSUCF1]